jgi:hypothetical protein
MPDRFSRRSVSTIEADDDDRPSPPRSYRGCGREHAPVTLIQLLKELSRSQQIHGFESFRESAKYQSERLTRRRYLTLPMSQARAGGDVQFPGKCGLRS